MYGCAGSRVILTERAQERGEHVMAIFHSLKNALDPQGILNPGKLFLPRKE